MRLHASGWAMAMAGLATLGAASPAQAGWIASWAASPSPPLLEGAFAAPQYENTTLRQTLRLSAGGDGLRIRFTNRFGAQALHIGGARIALLDADGREIPGSGRILHFGGEDGATIPAGAPFLSDRVELAVPDLARLRLDIYLPDAAGPCTCHLTGIDTLEASPPGNFIGEDFTPVSTNTMRAFVLAVEVDSPKAAGTIAAFGDSITDGIGSRPEGATRWPDRLAERLSASRQQWGIANLGISGNRVLSSGFGVSALSRFDQDVLSLPDTKWMILFEGVNDIGIAFGPPMTGGGAFGLPPMDTRPITAEQVIEGYRQLIARAHLQGIKVIGATITPYKGSSRWTEEGEAARRTINAFIRSSGEFDAVVDFDAVWRDPADPQSIREGYHMGDHLHGSDAGYAALADAIDLSLFAPPK